MKRFVQVKIIIIFICLLYYSSVYAERGIIIYPKKKTSEWRHALVVGNAQYKVGRLRNPVNDAKDMATALSQLGFKVQLFLNSNQVSMEEGITQFGEYLRKYGGIGLFFFAGHGMQIKGRNYLIPIDANIKREGNVKYSAIDAGTVLSEMESAENLVNIVILDACRNNPFARSWRGNNRGLAQMDAPSGSLIIYSTAPGSVAADGNGNNGIFTKHLLANINSPGVDVELLLRNVRIGVSEETNGEQIPWSASSMISSFSFNPGQSPIYKPAPLKKKKKHSPKTAEEIMQDIIKDFK